MAVFLLLRWLLTAATLAALFGLASYYVFDSYPEIMLGIVSLNVAIQSLLLVAWIIVGWRVTHGVDTNEKVALNVSEYLVLPNNSIDLQHRFTIQRYDLLEWNQAIAFHLAGVAVSTGIFIAFDTPTPALVHTILSLYLLFNHPLSQSQIVSPAKPALARPWPSMNPFL